MKKITELTIAEASQLISDIRDELFLDFDGQEDRDILNPDKEWSPDTLEEVGSLLEPVRPETVVPMPEPEPNWETLPHFFHGKSPEQLNLAEASQTLKNSVQVLKEFCQNVEAFGLESCEEDWPDLFLTYRKALAVLRGDKI